jgi:hypothetical protein
MKATVQAAPFRSQIMPKRKRCSDLGEKCIKLSSSPDLHSNRFSPHHQQNFAVVLSMCLFFRFEGRNMLAHVRLTERILQTIYGTLLAGPW